jgi:hypothetical protein
LHMNENLRNLVPFPQERHCGGENFAQLTKSKDVVPIPPFQVFMRTCTMNEKKKNLASLSLS